ncbi:MAG: rhodanese-like domain-containing protein [Fluviicola sp.]
MKLFFKQLLGIGPKADFNELMSRNAQIIDVRTSTEFSTGHVRGSINIPLSLLSQNLSKLKKDKPVITCCASGMRSESAKKILLSNGFKEVHNGGSWHSLQQKIH